MIKKKLKKNVSSIQWSLLFFAFDLLYQLKRKCTVYTALYTLYTALYTVH